MANLGIGIVLLLTAIGGIWNIVNSLLVFENPFIYKIVCIILIYGYINIGILGIGNIIYACIFDIMIK